MKLFLDYKLNDSGKGKFLCRLIPALQEVGVVTSFSHCKCDIALGVSWWRTKVQMPRVLRVDGIHFIENDKTNWKNDRIRKAIKRSTAVIYQSEYAKKEVIKKFKLKNKKCFVIFNGANPADYEKISMARVLNRDVVRIISSAKWCYRNGYRKHKRLKTIIQAAKMPGWNNVQFLVAGQTMGGFEDTSNLKFLGQLTEENLRFWLASSDIMFYPAEYDWCPNSVVESICAGLPVICTEGHGATELVRACGGKIINSKIDHDEIRAAIISLIDNPIVVNKEPVNIENIAKQYKAAFEDVLNESH